LTGRSAISIGSDVILFGRIAIFTRTGSAAIFDPMPDSVQGGRNVPKIPL
jgi:hypothetical protein